MDPGRKRSSRRTTAGLALALALALVLSGVAAFASNHQDAEVRGAEMTTHEHHKLTARAFHDDMRKLWEDHITWTRLFIVSFAADLPDLGPTTDRLLQNQVDIGRAFRPFYGDAAANRLTDLLTVHITTAADLLAAAKAGDTDAFDQASTAWYRNARQIASFWHGLNPENWPLVEMRQMMRDHLDLTLVEAADRLAGRYQQDIADYDAVHLEILHMADMLSDGIIRQFPGKFA
jgi:hypothetical protein